MLLNLVYALLYISYFMICAVTRKSIAQDLVFKYKWLEIPTLSETLYHHDQPLISLAMTTALLMTILWKYITIPIMLSIMLLISTSMTIFKMFENGYNGRTVTILSEDHISFTTAITMHIVSIITLAYYLHLRINYLPFTVSVISTAGILATLLALIGIDETIYPGIADWVEKISFGIITQNNAPLIEHILVTICILCMPCA